MSKYTLKIELIFDEFEADDYDAANKQVNDYIDKLAVASESIDSTLAWPDVEYWIDQAWKQN